MAFESATPSSFTSGAVFSSTIHAQTVTGPK
jgi:hypothetical protein